ncbi:hypothetical protein PAPYR_9648 [Paratrimastix pyriformis]|uniref:Ribosome biogenesis regulatory protein n=1 Tax=Paratrimastix pyriformis TaxID=342808 RepID=A0ABQ8U7W7_9EUKA|nr:hypothetical protein PAPYR_9648 [Paratrimastix pyriformis]
MRPTAPRTRAPPITVSSPSYLAEPVQSRPPRRNKPADGAPSTPDREDEVFISTLRVVDELSGATLKGAQKKEWDNLQLKKRHGIVKHAVKTPLPILRGMRLKAEKRHAREQEMAKEQDIALPSSMTKTKRSKRLEERKKSRTQGDKTGRGLSASVGSFRGGVLHIPQRLIDAGGRLDGDRSPAEGMRKRPRPHGQKGGAGKKKSREDGW